MLITGSDWQFSITFMHEIGKQINNYLTEGVSLKDQFQSVCVCVCVCVVGVSLGLTKS